MGCDDDAMRCVFLLQKALFLSNGTYSYVCPRYGRVPLHMRSVACLLEPDWDKGHTSLRSERLEDDCSRVRSFCFFFGLLIVFAN